MINKNNELPSFVNETNLPKIVDKLSNASNIKITGNKYGNRVQTVVDKIVEKADDVTKAIKQEVINNSYSFKVGTGDVDVSADVEDGFGEVGIKGVAYQNIFNNFSIIGESSKYITANGNTIKWTKSAVTTSNINIKYHNSLAQLNKTYTLVFYIYKNTLKREGAGDSYSVAKFNIVSYNSGFYPIPVNKTGLVKVKLIQPTAAPSDGKPYLEIYNDSVGELEISYPILLEGDHTNNPNLPSYFEGIVGVGDESKNLLNINTENHAHGVDFKFEKNVLKSSGIGSVSILQSFKITGLTIGKTYTISCNSDDVGVNSNGTILSLTPTTYRSFVFNDTESIYFQIRQDIDCTKEIKFLLEEGTKATSYEPYYDGHKIEILSHGKNLLYDTLDAIPSYLGNANDLDVYSVINGKHYYGATGQDYRNTHGSPMLSCKPNTTYSISLENPCRIEVGNPITGKKITDTNDFKTHLTFTTESNQHYMSLKIWRSDYINTEKKYLIGDIQIEESPTPTSYEPYTEDKTQILLDEPLMRLPNGVHDEITRDGKLIKRVGKSVLTGDENWTHYTSAPISDTNKLFGCDLGFRANNGRNLYCNHFIYTGAWSDASSEGIQIGRTNLSGYDIRINKSRLSTDTVTGFKQWLSQNPTTVYYELAEPVITELPAPYLRMFKDGHLTFNTLVAPESSHVVQLNKSGQIQNAIKESQSLDNRINVLENNYDNLMLSTISRLNNLELDYTLK